MQTKTIDKLEDLKDHKWEYNNKKFKIYDPECFEDRFMLTTTIINAYSGEKGNRDLFPIGLKNLPELEFYGLKVILNEKPKLTRKEREFLEDFETDLLYIARNERKAVDLRLFPKKPSCTANVWFQGANIDLTSDDFGMVLNSELFPFITWESGKAWSKSELMELEVVE